MLCPRHDFYEKSPTQRYVNLALSSTRCTLPSLIFIFGWRGLDVSRQFLFIMVALAAIHAARDQARTRNCLEDVK
jgi:hypothetical protein